VLTIVVKNWPSRFRTHAGDEVEDTASAIVQDSSYRHRVGSTLRSTVVAADVPNVSSADDVEISFSSSHDSTNGAGLEIEVICSGDSTRINRTRRDELARQLRQAVRSDPSNSARRVSVTFPTSTTS